MPPILPSLDQLRQTRVYQQSSPDQRLGMESRLNADMQSQAVPVQPPAPGPTEAAIPQQHSLLPQAPQPARQPVIDTSFGLPSERAYQQAEEQQRQQQARPAALLPRNPAEFSAETAQPERTWLDYPKDIGVGALKTSIGFTQGLQGLANIPTLGKFGQLTEKLGYKPAEAQEILDSMYSPAQQYASRQVNEAKGFIPTIQKSLEYPSTIVQAVGESSASMLGGMGAGKLVLSKAPTLVTALSGRLGMAAETVAGAIGEGAISAGALAEGIREQTEKGDLSLGQSALALAGGIGTGVLSMVGGKISDSGGFADIDSLFIGSGVMKKPVKAAKAIVAGGITEGLEEMPQEIQEQVVENAALGRPLMQGVPESAAQALLAGAAMGSGANIIAGVAGQESGIDDQGETTTAATQPASQPPVTEVGTATEMIDTVINGINTGQLNPDDPAQAEIINSVRKQMRAVAESSSPEVQEVVAKNRDVLERIGALEPEPTGVTGEQVDTEIDQATQFEVGEPQFPEEVALARAQAIQPKDRTPEEAKLVKQYQARADAEALAIRRARDLPDNLRTPEEREIARAAEQREQEGYAKEELKAGQTAQATEEAGTQSGKDKLPSIESLAGVVDFKNTSLDELQGIVRKVQETPFEQLSAQEKRVAEAIGTQSTPGFQEVQEAPEGVQTAPGKAAQPVQEGQAVPRSPEAETVTGQVQGDAATFSEQSGTLGVPRAEMPQITSEQRGALANNLRAKGIEYTRTEKTPKDLKPSQAEFSPEKVQQAREYTGPERAILVSQDGHVIDGHHQWVQKLEDAPNDPIQVIELGGNAQDVIQAVREFPSATTADGAKTGSRKKDKEVQTDDAGAGGKGGDESRTEASPAGKPGKSRKELLEPITEKEGTPQLDTEERTRYLGEKEGRTARTESKRRQIGKAEEFQETRRDPKKHTQITEQRNYKETLPANTERLMNITAERYRAFNDAQASVDENKEHLVRLFDKAGTDSITVSVGGQKFTVKKPLPGKEQVIMNLAGRDALDALKQKYKDAGLLTFDYDQGVTLMVQPAVAGKSKAAAYGPKSLEAAAREHVRFMKDLAEARFAKDAARRRITENIIPKLNNDGIDHVWTNSAKDTTFWVERSPAIKKFATEEAKEAYQQERKETQARPEFEKKRTRKLKTAGVSEAKAQGLKRGEKADRQAAAEAELDQILKSISGTPLPKGQRADIMGELTGQLGRGVLAQQKRGVFEVVSPERAAQAVGIVKGVKPSITVWHGTPHEVDKFKTASIGSGQGNQAAGYGLYFADKREIAEYYKETLSEKGAGHVYKVSLAPDESDIMRWDLPVPEQSKSVITKLGKSKSKAIVDYLAYLEKVKAFEPELNGAGQVYRDLSAELGTQKKASEHLLALGIKGIKYKESLKGTKGFNYVIFDDSDISIEAKYSKDGQRIEALYFPKTGKVWLVDGNIEKGEAVGVLAHDLGVHALQLGFKETEAFERILKRVDYLVEKGNDPEVNAARKRAIDAKTPANQLAEETLGYLMNNAKQHPLIRRLWAALKRFLSQKTNWSWASIENFTPADMQAMAQSAIRANASPAARTVSSATAGVNEFAQSVKVSTAKAADKIKGMANFKTWFGDSKVVDEDGEPLVVYHGTEKAFTKFDPEKTMDGVFWFSDSKEEIASGEAGAVGTSEIMPVYLKLENPANWDQYDNYSLAELENMGHDGVALSEEGEPTNYIVFNPNSIKSIHNTGEWSPTDPDIMKSYAKEQAETADEIIFKAAYDASGEANPSLMPKGVEHFSMSAPAQEARRNTENLNATKDGKTSTTSPEAGEKAIQSIMATLRKVTQKTKAELDKSKAKEKKLLDQYRELSSGLEAVPIEESVNLLNGLVRQADIPDGSKKRIGQLIKQITAAKRPETQRKRLNSALETLRSDISSRLRSQIRAQVKRAAGPKREGVIKRGRYWHEQEKDITAIREIVHNMSSEQATETISRVENRIDGLHERLKKAAPENAETIRNQITDAELRLHHLRTFGGLKDKSLEGLLDAKYQIEELRRLGRSRLRAVKEAWQQEIDRKTNWLAQEITGQDDPRPETVTQKNRRKQKEKSLVGRAKGAYQAVENSIQSFEHLLDRITIKSGKKIFQSRAVKELGSMAHAATRGAERYNRETTDQMLAKGLEIFGVKKGSTLTKRLQKLAKKTGKIKVAGDTLQLSPMEAAYFYNVRKEPGSEKLFRKMGFTPETWSGIDSLMTKELKAWADYLHDDLLADALNGETEAYRAVNGVDRVPVGLLRDDQTDIPVMNLNSAVMNRIFDANHYRAWAVPSKTFNDLFSVPETRGFIEQYAGTSTLKALDKFLEDFAKTPRELRGDMAWMDKLRSNVVMSMIGANPTTFFKQLTSIPAYAADIPTHAFVKNFAHGLANFGAVRRMIKDSQMARERFGSGYDRDIHEASKATAEQVIGGKITNMRDLLMAMTKLGDMAAVYAGYTVYKYHYDKNGGSKNHKEAHRIGIEEFERATERTQQAAGVKDRGSFERGSSLQKLLTMYMTSLAAYTRQTTAALRHFKTDPVGSSKRLLLFNVLLPMAFQAVASGFVGASGEDDEQWEEFWAKELRAVALGPFLGLPIARDIAAGLWDSAMGEWYGSDVQHSPVTETTKSLTQAVFHASKGLREFDDEAIEKAKGELLDFLGYAAGLPIKPGRRMKEGLDDFLSGDTEHPGLALLGWSRAARDERYLGD